MKIYVRLGSIIFIFLVLEGKSSVLVIHINLIYKLLPLSVGSTIKRRVEFRSLSEDRFLFTLQKDLESIA